MNELQAQERKIVDLIRFVREWIPDAAERDREDPECPVQLAEDDLYKAQRMVEELALRCYKAEADLEGYRAFVRGDHSITLDYKDASDLFRMNRTQDSETYTIRLSDLYRLAADKRGREEQDEEDAR